MNESTTKQKERNLFSRALTHGRKNQPRRRKQAELHKPVRTLCCADVPFVSCLAVLIGGEFKAAVRRAI
jgi:hypothetical protein